MSFILDALKKSETDRQQRGTAEFAEVPSSSAPARAPGWLLALAILLVINLLVLLGMMLRPSAEPAGSPPPIAATGGDRPVTDSPTLSAPAALAGQSQSTFASRVAEAKSNSPIPAEAEASETRLEPAVAPAAFSAAASQRTAALPTIYEVVADGSIVLPDLHLDIHVYSDVPGDRFVFINMSKQREQSQLSEGPLVEEITPDGVILGYQGQSFLLPRD